MNINKLFPRLTIGAKLGVAFGVLATLPVLAVSAVATRVTVEYVRTLTEARLREDLEMARAMTARALREVGREVAYLAEDVLGPTLRSADSAATQDAGRAVSALLSVSSGLFQVKAIRADGRVTLLARREYPLRSPGSEVSGLYYAHRARALASGEQLVLPVELREDSGDTDVVTTIPALAILQPVRGTDGTLEGVIVGEGRAAMLLADLEIGSPALRGVTGLVGSDGLLLYHSERKSDWANLLAARSEADLVDDISVQGKRSVLSGRSGTMQIPGERIVSYLPLPLADSRIGPLILYRVVPVSALEAPVRSLQRGVITSGVVILAFVLVLAAIAARQFTVPIYILRRGTRRLAAGLATAPIVIDTNDELEDLAHDFSSMATALHEHRTRLEDLVAERTRALREAHSELEDILEYSADAIAALGPDRRIRLWNRGAANLFGYSAVEAIGQDVDDLLLPAGERWEIERSMIANELEERGAVINLHTERAAKDGLPFPVSLTMAPIRDDVDRVVGYSLIIRDHRTQFLLEEQRRRSERLSAVNVMAVGLAHELKNPLAIIENRVEWMRSQVAENQAEGALMEDLGVVQEHARRLIDVTRDLLAFAKDDTHAQVPVDLNTACEGVAALMERTFTSRGITLVSDFTEGLGTLMGSETAIETVCMNLLLNAADATPQGGVVTLATRRSSDGGSVELEVRDSGPGIPVDLRHRVFEPFFTTKGASQGTGMGLALCRSIVDRHGGSIWVESEEGQGSRFIVLFPLSVSEAGWTNQES